jgi:ketosteroid isomerase-like protein
MDDQQTRDVRSAEETVRDAFAAFVQGDRSAIVAFVDPDFRWTFFNPFEQTPTAETCGAQSESFREFVAVSDENRANWQLVELVPFGDRVLVVTQPPPGRERPAWRSGEHTFHVVEVREGRIVAMRACLSRDEAVRRAGAKGESLTI